MAMQTDVKSAHINETGALYVGRTRLKGFVYSGNAAQAGNLAIFDSTSAAITGSYARSTTAVTVTKASHGLATGDIIGISFLPGSGVSATDGNYAITYVDANSFTITDPNSGTVAGGTACVYVKGGGRWLTSLDTLTGAIAAQQFLVPGEGILAANGLFATLSYITFVTVFYG